MSIFKDNDATRLYYSIINSARERVEHHDRMEKHHIIPDAFFIRNRSFRKPVKLPDG